MRRSLTATILLLASGLSAHSQQSASDQPPTMNARDMFWSASDLVGGVTPNPASKASQTVPEVAVDHRPPRKPKSVVKAKQIDPETVAANGYGTQPVLIRTGAERPGIRYTILEKDSKGGYSEVLPTTMFHNKDRVKISAMTNAPGYLYLIQQGTSGAWSPIFPGAGEARESNRVNPGQVYQIPSNGSAFELTGPPGEENLFIVFSRQPITDLEELIFGLREPSQIAPSSAGASAEILEAKNTISNTVVEQLGSRDLTPVQELINSSGNGDQDGEKAIYVVNASASSSASSRVIARFKLNHQ